MNKITTLFVLIITTSMLAYGQEESAGEVAKKLSNPIASLISLPFQNNLDVGIGAFNGSKLTTNIQPVIPIAITPRINLINRIILPVISLQNATAPGENLTGLADVLYSAFFSPAESELIWGVGPALLLPTGTDDLLTTGKFGAGPTAVVLKQQGPFTFGALANQVWSIAGDKDRANVSQFFLQPFFAYNWPSGAGLTANSEMIQNWETDTFSGHLNLLGSMVSKFGNQTVSFVIGPRIPLTKDTDGDWGLRAVITLIFPK